MRFWRRVARQVRWSNAAPQLEVGHVVERHGLTRARDRGGLDGVPCDGEVVVPLLRGVLHRAVEDAVRSLQIGAYDYLEKPIDFSRLIHSIHRALETRLDLSLISPSFPLSFRPVSVSSYRCCCYSSSELHLVHP